MVASFFWNGRINICVSNKYCFHYRIYSTNTTLHSLTHHQVLTDWLAIYNIRAIEFSFFLRRSNDNLQKFKYIYNLCSLKIENSTQRNKNYLTTAVSCRQFHINSVKHLRVFPYAIWFGSVGYKGECVSGGISLASGVDSKQISLKFILIVCYLLHSCEYIFSFLFVVWFFLFWRLLSMSLFSTARSLTATKFDAEFGRVDVVSCFCTQNLICTSKSTRRSWAKRK